MDETTETYSWAREQPMCLGAREQPMSLGETGKTNETIDQIKNHNSRTKHDVLFSEDILVGKMAVLLCFLKS
jgi:hypothetical protein